MPTVNVKPFLKLEEGNPFYVLPVISGPLFPQFKGAKSPGVLRPKHQQGRLLSAHRSWACLMVL